MKKLLIVILFLSGFLTQAGAQSMLKVSLADNSPINVSVDHRFFNKRGQSVTVGDLPYGRHFLQIHSAMPGRRGRMFQDIIYEGKVKTAPGMITVMIYDPVTGGINTHQEQITAYNAHRPAYSVPRDQYDDEQDNGNNGAGRGNYNNNSGNGQYGERTDGNNSNNYRNNEPPATPVNAGTLTAAKIDNLKTKVTAKNTDTERMNIVKEALKDEQITTSQAGDMMDWFNFESSKVDFAEWAYTITVDKGNFMDLENKCKYKNYQDDLDKFIKAQK